MPVDDSATARFDVVDWRGPSTIVLDTNVVFDWLVFADPAAAGLGVAVATGAVRWIATAAMRDECFHVLGRGRLDAWEPDVERVRRAWDRHCELVAAPTDATPVSRIRCSDPDDQMFVDLAIARQTRWLVSKDRALLRLAAGLRASGITVSTPAAWARRASG